MSFWRVWQFTLMLHAVGVASEGASKLTAGSVEHVKGLAHAAQEYSKVSYSYWAYRYGDPFATLIEAGGKAKGAASGGGGDGGGGPTTVILELDGKVLGRTVEALLGKRNKLRTVTT